MSEQATSFDPVLYRATSREEWDTAAEAWFRWGATIQLWLGEATEAMLDAAGVNDGKRVLDVAAGAGSQTLAIARRVGPSGSVLVTDASLAMLWHADDLMREAGITTVETQVLDAEAIDLEPETFDVVISRLGLSYLVDPAAALEGIRRVLRPGGRVGALVFSSAMKNPLLSLPAAILRLRGKVPPPSRDTPGHFRLGAPGALKAELLRAGFRDVTVQELEAPLDLPTGRACARFLRETHRDLDSLLGWLPPHERDEAWAEVESALGGLEKKGGGFEGDCRVLIGSGTKY